MEALVSEVTAFTGVLVAARAADAQVAHSVDELAAAHARAMGEIAASKAAREAALAETESLVRLHSVADASPLLTLAQRSESETLRARMRAASDELIRARTETAGQAEAASQWQKQFESLRVRGLCPQSTRGCFLLTYV
jgi:hypothetical protein